MIEVQKKISPIGNDFTEFINLFLEENSFTATNYAAFFKEYRGKLQKQKKQDKYLKYIPGTSAYINKSEGKDSTEEDINQMDDVIKILESLTPTQASRLENFCDKVEQKKIFHDVRNRLKMDLKIIEDILYYRFMMSRLYFVCFSFAKKNGYTQPVSHYEVFFLLTKMCPTTSQRKVYTKSLGIDFKDYLKNY